MSVKIVDQKNYLHLHEPLMLDDQKCTKIKVEKNKIVQSLDCAAGASGGSTNFHAHWATES